MNQQEHQGSAEERNEEPGIEGVDVAGGVPSPSYEGSADSNGRKQHPASEATSAVAGEGTGTDGEIQALDGLRGEVLALKDAWARERAEFQNYKRRISQEMGRMKTHAVANFVGGLLPVLDNLESVVRLSSDNEEVRQFIAGVSMIHKELTSLLDRHNIKTLRPAGEAFNPESMEAIASEDREDLKQDTVLEVFQDGLVMEFDDGLRQVLRPARVRVGRPTGNTEKES